MARLARVDPDGTVRIVEGAGALVVGEWITVGTDGVDGVDALLAANPHPYATGDSPGPPPFLNSWTNRLGTNDYPVQFKLTADNFIHIRGVAVGGTDNTVIFNLPSPYRSSKYQPLDQRSTNTGHYAEITVQSDGDVLFEQEIAGIQVQF